MSRHKDICGIEHVHSHSDFSLLDGYQTVEEMAQRIKSVNQQYLCVSDHGVMGAVPRQIRAAEKQKLNAIFACELYVNPLQPELKVNESSADYAKEYDPETKPLFRKSYHLLGIAYNRTGYSNLVKLSSWGWTKGFYYRPRINHDILMQHREGIIFTSCCYNGEIGQAFDKGGDEAAFAMVEKYMAMFGDKFYFELMLLDFKKQKPFDAFIIRAHEKYGIPLIITNDCHYSVKEDSKMQRLMIMVQTGATLSSIQKKLEENENADLFELQEPNLYIKSEQELNEKYDSDYSDIIPFELFQEAKRNTVRICQMAKGVELDRSIKLPKFEDADMKLLEAIEIGFKKRGLPKNAEYADRIKEEYSLITQKGFSSYFLIQKMMTDEARRISPLLLGWGDGSEAVGPGRGSVCGSLVAYCVGITDVDPIKHDLLFSRFLSPARGGRTMQIRFKSDPISQMLDQAVDPKLPEDDCPFDVD